MVVFFSNCDSVEFHHELFRRDLQLSHSGSHSQQGDAAEPVKLLGSVPVLKLHGDMLQPERTSSLVTFAKVGVGCWLCWLVRQLQPLGTVQEMMCLPGDCFDRQGHAGSAEATWSSRLQQQVARQVWQSTF